MFWKKRNKNKLVYLVHDEANDCYFEYQFEKNIDLNCKNGEYILPDPNGPRHIYGTDNNQKTHLIVIDQNTYFEVISINHQKARDGQQEKVYFLSLKRSG